MYKRTCSKTKPKEQQRISSPHTLLENAFDISFLPLGLALDLHLGLALEEQN